MTLKEYVDTLNQFLNKNPDCADFQVVTSNDDEGNEYTPIIYAPSRGMYNDDKDFTSASMIEEYGFEESDLNAVCVN